MEVRGAGWNLSTEVWKNSTCGATDVRVGEAEKGVREAGMGWGERRGAGGMSEGGRLVLRRGKRGSTDREAVCAADGKKA